jgi:hypothetical protein
MLPANSNFSGMLDHTFRRKPDQHYLMRYQMKLHEILNHFHRRYFLFLLIISTFILNPGCNRMQKDNWKPAPGPLLTQWAKNVNPENVHQEYPRPQMVREEWKNLNGLWEYAIRPKTDAQPGQFDGNILVPFSIESVLSGVGKTVGDSNLLWYKRTFKLPSDWSGKRIIINFGAVDWETIVRLNNKEVGQHRGGYDAFSMDITDDLKTDGLQEIVLSVWDPTDNGTQPRGKQVSNPHGIWYTSVTGVWQTVWLEAVSPEYIESFKIEPDIEAGAVTIKPECKGAVESFHFKAIVKNKDTIVASKSGDCENPMKIEIDDPQLWTPENPFLYDLILVLLDKNGTEIDRITSYFGMRKISLDRDELGFTRLMLNNEFVFQFGPLDQGWWPDGLYTAPSDEALRYDIEVTKKLGFNMARKHVKVEPARWYYWCDKLGLLVWQDMPSGDKFIGGSDPDIQRTPESAQQFEKELNAMVNGLYNHPSIIVWVTYNEGWGQWDTPRITKLIKSWDATRLVNSASGWTDRGTGDMHDIHSYPGPAMPDPESNRAIVLGEFGGLGLPLEGHTWQVKDNWGYRSFTNRDDLQKAYLDLILKLEPMKNKGLSAAVYTQTTDVEVEVNGLMTYDRALIKMNADEIALINKGYLPPVISAGSNIFLDTLIIKLDSHQPGRIYYTLDGTTPDENANLYTEPIQITNSVDLKAVTLFENGKMSGVNEAVFKKVKPRVSEKTGKLISGVRYKYYENDGQRWSALPDLSELSKIEEGITEGIDLTKIQRGENFALLFEGYFKAEKDGIYTFYTTSDDGSKLSIGDDEIVSNDFLHGMEEKSGQIALKAGYHPIKVTFFQSAGGKGLEVGYKIPGGKTKQDLSKYIYYQQ